MQKGFINKAGNFQAGTADLDSVNANPDYEFGFRFRM